MAYVAARHELVTPRQTHDRLEAILEIVLTAVAVLVVIGLVWYGIARLMSALDHGALDSGGGLVASLPIGLFATLMTVTYWLPMFMPALIPIALAVLVATWAIARAVHAWRVHTPEVCESMATHLRALAHGPTALPHTPHGHRAAHT